VLIVDDDRGIRESLKSVVESAGHQAFVAGNGREAIDLLRKIPRPALILLDLMMPVMTGWELLALLREDDAFSAIPVVIVSAVPSKDAVGATRVIQKPLDVDVLLNIVEEFCG
jgi:CheY-like chemotaxis protein